MSQVIPEIQIIEALVSRLETITQANGYQSDTGKHIYVGYDTSDSGKNLTFPAMLIQLESLQAVERNGNRAKYQLDLNISMVIKTGTDATWQLLKMNSDLRHSLSPDRGKLSAIRTLTMGETRFDIGSANSRLSFADLTLQLETVLQL